MGTTIFVGELMTQRLETIGSLSSAQEASKKMRDNNVSSLVVIDDSNNKPIGIVTERDLVRKVCVNDTSESNSSSNNNSGSLLIKNIMSSPLVTIDAREPIEAAADVMIQNKIRHLLVVENNDINRPIGIVTPTDLVAYIKENLNVNEEANAKILESLKGGQEEEENVVEELEQEGKLKKNSQEGGQEYEDEEPRQG
ncbi:MAG: CBS domain-containing protein [Thermoproteota archaeon]|nr:CBS domain-containing protein [Thermoproteota archaeon]